jgi:sugar-specific transcriptional regulator TrmB
LEPCINKTKIKEIQQSKPKEAEPVPPKSVIRERINLMEDLIKNTNKDINMIIASLEL